MSIFNQKIDYSKYADNTDCVDNYVNEEAIEPCEEDSILEANTRILVESEYNFNKFMQQVGVAELSYLQENGQEMVYEGSTSTGFFETMKNFFINLWKKIVALFMNFFAMFDSATKTDKDFLNKYRKYLNKIGDISDMDYKGFEYDTTKIDIVKVAKNTEDAIKDISGFNLTDIQGDPDATKEKIKAYDEKDDVFDKLRAESLGKSESFTQNEFQKELFSLLRSGEESKVTIDKISVSKYIRILEGSKQKKKDAENAYKTTKKTIDECIRACERAKTKFERVKDGDIEQNSRNISAASIVLKLEKERLAIVQTANTALLKAIKDENSQARAILVKAMSYKKKEKGSESAFMKESASIFGNVDFI